VCLPGGNTVSVIRDPAIGAITLHLMSFFFPSMAKVFVNPTIPSLAINRQQNHYSKLQIS